MPFAVKFIEDTAEGSDPRSWDIKTDVSPTTGDLVMFDDLRGHRTYIVKQVMHWYLLKPHLNTYSLQVEVSMELLKEHEDRGVRVEPVANGK